MSTKIGVGHSEMSDSKKAGIAASRMALDKGKIENPDFALIFCSGKHDPWLFMEGVNEILGDTPKTGGSALGIITNDFIGYEGFEVGVTVISSDTISFKLFKQGDLNIDEMEAGSALGKQIASSIDDDDHSLLLFYDSSKQQNPPMLNFATLLFAGLQPFLPDRITSAGGGFLADMQLNTCYQFFNHSVLTQHAVAVVLGGQCKMYTTIMHGCKPASSYMTITKTAGPVIYEINDLPALDVIDELLGRESHIPWKDFALFITLGLNKGDKFGVFDEKSYANRLTLAVDEQNKALIMFEPDLKPGDEVQLMRRSVDLNYIHSGINELNSLAKGTRSVFYFYIDCSGRSKPYSGGEFEDAAEVQKAISGKAPLMGFYSGVEIAKVGDSLQPLDWTGVLCMFVE
jgi:hypothetical protein